MGSYPSDLNILDHNINRMEYIQLFSLLSKAARETPFNQSCVRLNTYNDPIAEAQPTSYPRNDGNDYDYSHFRPEEPNPARKAPRQEEESQPSRTKKPRKLSWLERYKSKFDRLLSEPEDEEENDF